MAFSPNTIDQLLSSSAKWRKKIPDLDRIGRRIRNRNEPYATLEEIKEIVDWKWTGAGVEFEKLNSSIEVQETTRKAFAKTLEEDVVNEMSQMGQVRLLWRLQFSDLSIRTNWDRRLEKSLRCLPFLK